MAKIRITKQKTFKTLVEKANQRGGIPEYSYNS